MGQIKEWKRIPDDERKKIEPFLQEVPVALGAIARALGIPVKAATLEYGISGEIRPSEETPSGYVIRINRHEPKMRQRFTLAHEIAHYLLHRDQIGDGISDTVLYRAPNISNKLEIEANRLAAELVMPAKQVQERLRQLGEVTEEDVEALADEFGVSKPAMEVRVGF